MSELYKQVDDIIEKVARPGPSLFQLNYFVIGKEPTLQAKLHKCLQEMKDRRNAIKNVELEIEEITDTNSLIEIELKKVEKRIQGEERAIRKRQAMRKIMANESHCTALKAKIDSWNEEIKFLKSLYDQISEQTKLQSWDDYEVQLEYWSEKMAQEIKSRLLLNAPVDCEVIKTAMALPDKAPVKKELLDFLKASEKKSLTSK